MVPNGVVQDGVLFMIEPFDLSLDARRRQLVLLQSDQPCVEERLVSVHGSLGKLERASSTKIGRDLVYLVHGDRRTMMYFHRISIEK